MKKIGLIIFTFRLWKPSLVILHWVLDGLADFPLKKHLAVGFHRLFLLQLSPLEVMTWERVVHYESCAKA